MIESVGAAGMLLLELVTSRFGWFSGSMRTGHRSPHLLRDSRRV